MTYGVGGEEDYLSGEGEGTCAVMASICSLQRRAVLALPPKLVLLLLTIGMSITRSWLYRCTVWLTNSIPIFCFPPGRMEPLCGMIWNSLSSAVSAGTRQENRIGISLVLATISSLVYLREEASKITPMMRVRQQV